jgi:hypothetical protein
MVWMAAAMSASAHGAGGKASKPVPAGPIVITQGGTYSGTWRSDDPKVAAVTIRTNDPVVVRNSHLSSRGDLLVVSGVKTGANVTVENVTGTALDPGVSGQTRGSFLKASNVASLVVKNNTMTGVLFGIKVWSSQPTKLEILNNQATDLEDRASDGNGGFLAKRPAMGHFVILNGVSAASGAEIAWNKVVQTIGQTSTEDVINIYESQGTAAHPIYVHDNYMEGASSPVYTNHYTGTALITDGAATDGNQPTAYVDFENNQVVATAGTGVGIAAGHDIQASGNHVVSCGVTADGNWYAWGANAVVIWNFYKNKSFYNNHVSGTVGGVVAPDGKGGGKKANEWMPKDKNQDSSSAIERDSFTDPCLVNGKVSLRAEDDERALWAAKLAAHRQTVGAR